MRQNRFASFYQALCVAMVLASASVFSPLSWGVDVQYVYDPAGHLVQVINTDGTSAQYQYDAAGNVLNTTNSPTGVALVNFLPTSGLVGSNVTISGNNFITTPAQNTVTFNGTNATVVSATANTLVVTVPASATTGAISITNANGTITSATSFTVLTAMSISGFTPSSGSAGATVTISGTGFDPTTGGDIVQFNGHVAAVTSVSATQIQATVPTGTSTGPISVSTSTGSVVSATNFLIPPGILSASSIFSVITPPAGGSPQVITQSAVNTNAVLLIPGGDNNLYTVQFSNLSLTGSTSVSYTLYAPDNTAITLNDYPISSTKLSLHLPRFLLSGYYTVVLTAGAGTGSYSVALESAPTINLNGTPSSGMVPLTYQSKRYVFTGGNGQNLGLGITNVSVPGASAGTANVVFAIADPNGTVINSTGYCLDSNNGTCSLNVNSILAGVYSVIVTPAGTNANCASGAHCTFNVLVTPDKAGTSTPGTLSNLSINSYGQNLRYTFVGTQGQSLALEVTNIVANPSPSSISVTITTPSGTTLSNPMVFNASDGAFRLPTLPASGTYILFAEPTVHTAATATFNLLLDTGIVVPVNGTATSGSISQPLPAGRFFTFSGTAGQNLGVGITNVVTPGAPAGSGFVYYTVYDPNGNTIGSGSCYDSDLSSCSANLVNLPVTTNLPTVGYYGILVTPGMGNCSSGSPCTFKVTVTPDKFGTLTPNIWSNLSIDSRGQNLRYSFSASTGQTLAIDVANLSTLASSVQVSICIAQNPCPQSPIATWGITTASLGFTKVLAPLPASTGGLYTIFIEPNNKTASIATMSALVDTGTTVPVNGTATSGSITVNGASKVYTFSGTAAQNLGLGLTIPTMTGSATTAAFTVYKPDGTQLTTGTCTKASGAGCSASLSNLAITGLYSVVVTPGAGATCGTSPNCSFNLYMSADATGGILTVGATAVTYSSTIVSQNARYTFTSDSTHTAGTLKITNYSYGTLGVTFTVIKTSNGVQVASQTLTANGNISLPGLTTSTGYTVIAHPTGNNTGSFKWQVTEP